MTASLFLTAPVALFLFVAAIVPVDAQQPSPPTPAVDHPAPGDTSHAPVDKRIFGVLPNYRTANAAAPFVPLAAKRKFYIATKDSLDYPSYILAGAFAALYQLDDSHPSFGQGMAGYGRRYATAVGDQIIGNYMTEAIMPSLTHEDPRYFRRGYGSKWSRIGYAATRIFVTRTDSGGTSFNCSEIFGNAIAAGVANAYYPDERRLSDNFERLYTQLATDSFSQVLKEFWPDVKRHYLRKHRADKE